MNLVFVGNKFYRESGTVMSSIYQEVAGKLSRANFGFVERALENGEEVHIRPANKSELAWAEKKLEELKYA